KEERAKRVAQAASKRRKKNRLFASRQVSAPPKSREPAGSHDSQAAGKKAAGRGRSHPTTKAVRAKTTSLIGQVLVMRIRKASKTARATQTQLPLSIGRSEFFGDPKKVVSRKSRKVHALHAATAR